MEATSGQAGVLFIIYFVMQTELDGVIIHAKPDRSTKKAYQLNMDDYPGALLLTTHSEDESNIYWKPQISIINVEMPEQGEEILSFVELLREWQGTLGTIAEVHDRKFRLMTELFRGW